MARIRSVHPSFFTDEACVSCSPLARLLYIGLWTDADDQGVFEWRPLQIKMRLLPGDLADASALLAELEEAKLIAAFSHAGKQYGAIREFRRFQRPKKPNAVHVLPAEFREYVCIDIAGSEPVPHQFPTSGEKSPQMEDEGEDVEEREANASLAADGDEAGFEAVWKAYPHVKGRSSKPKSRAEWDGLAPAERAGMLAAVGRYRAEGREPQQPCGAPGLEKWLRDRRFLDWLIGAEPMAAGAWNGPSELRQKVVERYGEDYARSWLDPTHWTDLPAPAIVCKLPFSAKRLSTDLKALLKPYGASVKTEQAA